MILEIPGYEGASIWGKEDHLPALYAQLEIKGRSLADPPEAVIVETDLESLVLRIVDVVRPPMSFDQVFFILVETDPLPPDLLSIAAAYIAQSRDVDFLRRAAQSSEPWVVYEAKYNPHYESSQR